MEIPTRPLTPSPLPPPTWSEYYDLPEIVAAFNALTDSEIARIVGFARFRIIGISGRNGDTDAEDLFSEAALLTLNRKRKWKRRISLFNHLLATMRSIADNRFKRGDKLVPISDTHPAPTVAQSAVDAEKHIACLEQALQDDSIALKVLETMGNTLAPRDAHKQLGISLAAYWSARKRIRRKMEALRDESRKDTANG